MSCSRCNCNPCSCGPALCDPNNEPLASALENIRETQIGPVVKTCENGKVVYALPCGLDVGLVQIPILPGESIDCYFLRVLEFLYASIPGTITYPITVDKGGTNATSSGNARINLGVEIGVDVQAWCANLDVWCGKTAPSGAVVGTTDSQVISNKEFTNPANTIQTLTDQANIDWNANLGGCAVVTLAASRHMNAPTNLKVGTYMLQVIQGGGGGNALTWDAIFHFTGNVAPTLSAAAGKRDVIPFYFDGNFLCGNTQILNDV